jgi:beta-glucosidase
MLPAVRDRASSRPGPPLSIDHDAVRALLAADLAPLAGLEVDVATSSFQSEGELDGPGQPATNWRAWIRAGRVEGIGAACGLWRRFDEAAARCRAMELDVFCLSLEWARLAPVSERLDPRAVEAYAHRLGVLRAAGLEPVVTL